MYHTWGLFSSLFILVGIWPISTTRTKFQGPFDLACYQFLNILNSDLHEVVSNKIVGFIIKILVLEDGKKREKKDSKINDSKFPIFISENY